MKNAPLKINLKSCLSFILTFILVFAVIAPTISSAASYNADAEKEEGITGDIIDFSTIDFSNCNTRVSKTITQDGVDLGGYTIEKKEHNYTITLNNLTAKKIILPTDDADGANGRNSLKKDADGKIAERKTHITIKLEGENKITEYGMSGYYVKGLKITGSGTLNVTAGSGGSYKLPGIMIETDDIKEKDEKSGFIIDANVEVKSERYWGIICNGEILVKNGKTLTVKGEENHYGSISADRLFKDNGATVNANKIYIYKTSTDKKGTYYSDGNSIGNNESNKKTNDNKPKPTQQSISKPPVITGAKAGKVYCEEPVITVTDDKEIASVEVNGIKITKFISNSWTEKIFAIPTYMANEKEIVVTDSDGNKTKLKFISYNEHPSDQGTVKNSVAATCTTSGYHEVEYKCRVCNKVIKTEKVVDPALEHSYGAWQSISSAQDKHTCTKCGHEEIKDKSVKIAETKVSLSKTNYVYDGTRKEPTVIVKDGNETLVNGRDYVTSYSNNVEAGKATVTVTGKDHYTGTITVNFKIEKKTNSITASNMTTNCSTRAQSMTIGARQNGNAKLSYSSNNKSVTVDSLGKVTIAKGFAGKATITITAKATTNYEKATKTITVTVNKVNNKITASNFTKKYSTKAQSFSIGAKQVGNAKLTYSSDNKNVKVNDSGKVTIAKGFIGKATITITANANQGYNKATKKITIIVNPPSITISKLSNGAGKKMTVTWKRDKAVTGYEIQYSTDKNFKKGVKTVKVNKNSTTSKTITKLTKNKTYYVRIRSYKTVSKVNYYSSWNVKNIKIKK